MTESLIKRILFNKFSNLRNKSFEHNVQILPEVDRPQKSLGRRAPGASSNRALRDHAARLEFAVDVSVVVAQLGARLQKSEREGSVPGTLLHGQVAASRVVRRLGQVRVAVVLGLEEVGQHFVVAPAWVAHALPVVVVVSVAAHVQHRVQHRRAAQNFSARPVAPLVVHR